MARFFVRLDDAVAIYRDRRTAVWLGMGISVVAQLLNILSCYFFGRAMGDDLLPFIEYLYLVPAASSTGLWPMVGRLMRLWLKGAKR